MIRRSASLGASSTRASASIGGTRGSWAMRPGLSDGRPIRAIGILNLRAAFVSLRYRLSTASRAQRSRCKDGQLIRTLHGVGPNVGPMASPSANYLVLRHKTGWLGAQESSPTIKQNQGLESKVGII